MKKVKVVKVGTVEVKPFMLADFIQNKERQTSMKKLSKKSLKSLADTLGLDYDEKQISFTKKLMTAYLERQESVGK